MPLSAFADENQPPTDATLAATLGSALPAWQALQARLSLTPAWSCTAKSVGWGLRLNEGERMVVALIPQRGVFLASLALGEKAVAAAQAAGLPTAVLDVIEAAPRYAEGRGVRIPVRDVLEVTAIERLVAIKLGR